MPTLLATVSSLHSVLMQPIVQMPPRVPVATVAVNGAMNAGLLAVQILATADEVLAKKYAEFKRKLADA